MREMTEIEVIFAVELTPKGKDYIEKTVNSLPHIEKLRSRPEEEIYYRMVLADTGYVKSYALLDVLEVAFSMLDDIKLKIIQEITDSTYGECMMEIFVLSKDVFPEMYISNEYVKRISYLHMNVDIDLY